MVVVSLTIYLFNLKLGINIQNNFKLEGTRTHIYTNNWFYQLANINKLQSVLFCPKKKTNGKTVAIPEPQSPNLLELVDYTQTTVP